MDVYRLEKLKERGVDHLNENYYSDLDGVNFNYTDTTHECINKVIEDSLNSSRELILDILKSKTQLNDETIKMVGECFSDYYQL